MEERKNLLKALQKIQEEAGYISKDAMLKLADSFHISPSEVYSIVSFYKRFRKKPLGKYPITVCCGTACYLMGGDRILSVFEKELNIEVGDTTEDEKFSLEKAACFGCCHFAPVVKIKEEIYPRMSPAKVEEVIVNLKAREDEVSKT